MSQRVEILLSFIGVAHLYLFNSIRQVKLHIGMPMKGLRRNDDKYC